MVCLIGRLNSHGLSPVATSKGASLHSPSRTVKDFVARFETVLTRVGGSLLSCFCENVVSSCLPSAFK
jgi:hypothetical protein